MKKKTKLFSLLLIVALLIIFARSSYSAVKTQMVSVGDYKLYVEDNNPISKESDVTIVFETGYGDDMTSFDELMPLLEGKARLIRYDRAGLGKSEDSDEKKTSDNQVKDLEIILNELDVEGKLIFVGHSIAGYNARLFAKDNEIAGLVLIDSSHERQNEELFNLFPEDVKSMYMEQFSVEGSYEDIIYSANLVSELRDVFRDKALIVIAGNQHGLPEIDEAWALYQADIASLSNDSEIHTLESGHYVHKEKTDFVANKIIEMIDKLK